MRWLLPDARRRVVRGLTGMKQPATHLYGSSYHHSILATRIRISKDNADKRKSCDRLQRINTSETMHSRSDEIINAINPLIVGPRMSSSKVLRETYGERFLSDHECALLLIISFPSHRAREEK